MIKLRHFGDVLLTVPVFRALRENFPDVGIAALVNCGMEDVLKESPLVDEIFSYDRGVKDLYAAARYLRELDFLRSIRSKKFDMTVDLTGGDRAAIISLMSGARYRLGMESLKGFPGKRHLYTHLSRIDGKRHTVLQNIEVTERFGISTPDLSVDFCIPEKDRASVGRLLSERGVKPGDTLVHIHPVSRWLFKCWRDEYMARVIDHLSRSGAKVVITSSPENRELGKTKNILSFVTSRIIDLSGKTTIKELAAVSEAADLFFGVDSAPMHIAAAVGTPVIALFGPSGAFHWGPWDNEGTVPDLRTSHSEVVESGLSPSAQNPYPKQNGNQVSGIHTVVQRDWECIPCGKDGCDGSKKSRCLEDIKPEEVLDLLERRLKDTAK